jgi:hypothetical protein
MVISLDEFTTAVASGRASGHGAGLPIAVIIVIIVAAGVLLWRSRWRHRGPGE